MPQSVRTSATEPSPIVDPSSLPVPDPLPAPAPTRSLRERFAGGAAWIGLSRLAMHLLGLAATFVLARLLEPRDYGLLAMAAVFTGLVEQIHDLGIGQALVQRRAVSRENEQAAFTLILSSSLALYLALYLLAPTLGALYGDARVVPVLRVVALTFPLGAFAVVPRALLRRELTLRGEAVTSVSTTVAESLAMIVLAALGYGVWALVAGRLVSQVVTAVGLFLARPWSLRPRLRGGEGRSLLRLGGGLTLSSLLWYAYSNADFFVVGRVLGSAALGSYSMAWKLAKMPWDRLWYSINPMILPLFARAREQEGGMARALSRLTRYMALLTAPGVAGLGAVADDVVLVFLGAKWESAIAPLRWLCAYGVARAVLVLLPPALVAAGRIRQEIVFNALCFVALPLAFVGGVRAGPWGVAAAWALVYPALALVWLLPRALAAAGMGLTAYLRPLVRPLAAAGIMVAVVMAIGQALPSPGPLRLAVRVGAGVLAYLGCVRVMEGAVFGELRALLADARRGMKP